MGERQLVFRDEQGHHQTFVMGDRDHLKFSKAFDAFLAKHVSAENTTFRLERVLTDEVLTLETALGIVGRTRGGTDAESSYRRSERHTDTAELHLRFAYNGYGALDNHGPWTTDHDSMLPDPSFENVELAWVDGLRREQARRKQVAAMPKLDGEALRQFCRIWADTGYNEYAGDGTASYVLLSGRSDAETGADGEALAASIATLGLQTVERPADAPSGEVRVRADPRVDLELERWA